MEAALVLVSIHSYRYEELCANFLQNKQADAHVAITYTNVTSEKWSKTGWCGFTAIAASMPNHKTFDGLGPIETVPQARVSVHLS